MKQYASAKPPASTVLSRLVRAIDRTGPCFHHRGEERQRPAPLLNCTGDQPARR
jgi:hypothetical protein